MMTKKYYSMLAGATFTCVINALLIITDTVLAGILLGHEAVASINLVAGLYNLGVFIAMLLSLGVPILYSNEMGNFQKKEADRVFGTGLTFAVLGGVLLFIFTTVFRPLYFSFYNVPSNYLELANDYYFWLRFELLLMPVAEVMVETVYADGDEGCTLLVTSVEAASNILFSMLLCRKMGIAGLALGSVIAVSLRLLLSLTHLFKKKNTLRPNVCFSFPVLGRVIAYSVTDAGCYLFIAIFSFALNKFVLWRFGSSMLIMASIILLVHEFQLFFDGIGEAITPIISVYLAENCFPGVRKVWRLAVKTAIAEGIFITILLLILSRWLPGVLGITDPDLIHTASLGIILMAPGMTFVCLLYLLSSYYLLVDKVALSFSICALRDVVVVLPSAVVFGMIFGIHGVFAGTAVGAVLAFLISILYVYGKYGKENVPLLLAEKERSLGSYLFELEISPERIVETRNQIENALNKHGIRRNTVVKCMLMFEELLMLIHENHPDGKTLGECSLTVSPEKITVVLRDNGPPVDFTDCDMEIDSLRCYVVPGLISHWCRRSSHLIAMSFNRNMFELTT